MNKIIIGLIFSLISFSAQSQLIVDNGHFFSENEITELGNKMKKIEADNSVQILIYSTMDLNGMSPVEYGKGIGNKYKVGERGINNGILILLSKNDRKLQILNGYGIEWIISDNETQEIVNQMTPFFKQRDFFGGLNNGLTLIEKKTSKIDWSINTTKLDNLSKNDIGEIVKFEYTNKTGNTNYKYAINTDPQFSNGFQIKLESDGKEFSLFYSKNMNELVNMVLTKKGIIVFARLTDWDTKRLELLGIE